MTKVFRTARSASPFAAVRLQFFIIVPMAILFGLAGSWFSRSRAYAITCPTVAGASVIGHWGEDRGNHIHAGIDIDVSYYSIYASESGNIIHAGPYDGYGLTIDLESGGRVYRYAHLSRIDVSSGSVGAGEIIGQSGNTGSSNSPHLHWEIRTDGGGFGYNGTVDPEPEYGSCSSAPGGEARPPSTPPSGGGSGGGDDCHGQVLRQGSSGACVSHLQNHLNDYGYGLGVDGAFGSGTGNAVRDFQSRHNLSADGVVGGATWNALHSSLNAPSPSIGPVGPQAASGSKPAVYRGGVFYLRNSLSSGNADQTVSFGNSSGDIPLMGDWDGNGTKTPGIYRTGNATFYLRNANSSGVADIVVQYGNGGDKPLVGDWNGDGVDTIGVWRAGAWYLRNSNSPGSADVSFAYGDTTDVPLVGDWDGNKVDTPAIWRRSNATFYLRNSNSSGVADATVAFGDGNDKALAGDWNGDGQDSFGVYRSGTFYLSNSNVANAPTNESFGYGNAGDVPLVWR